MADIVISPATADRFDDAEHALSGGGDGAGCQCQWWSITNAEFNSTSRDERQALLLEEMAQEVPPALIAYVDGEAAGWVKVGPRPTQRRLPRTRMITQSTTEPIDDDTVWAVTCFVVRREHRGTGLNARLLDAAVAFAHDHGARAIEAYPVDTGVGTHPANELYHGVLTVFENAGFVETARPKPDRPIVLLDLSA
ncbi:GNAT family N-acetyltransferase [Microbacterium sp. CJ88]|uniref:GNAT family N-acetyltransferase n=1 Tax=Microbacterium sp. CJ88 TaxID=3445672 RepID=UPI003F65FD8C